MVCPGATPGPETLRVTRSLAAMALSRWPPHGLTARPVPSQRRGRLPPLGALPLVALQARAGVAGGARRRRPAPGALALDVKPRRQAEEEQLASFRSWLRAGGVELSGVRLQRSGLGGLGLFAQRSFEEGEVILKVPESLCLKARAVRIERNRGRIDAKR